MKKNVITGVVEGITDNGVTINIHDKREYIQFNDEVISGISVGDTLRVVYKNGCVVRVFNISTELLYEVDITLTKSSNMKKQSLILIATSVICAIPIIGALIGLALIAALIGSSVKYGRNVLAKVIGLSFVTAIAYVAIAVTLMINGHFLLSFLACTVLVYVGLTFISKIQDTEAAELSKVAIADDHCLNFKVVNL